MYLSRHLYEKEEIKYSYILSILHKTSLDECFFWIMEYFFSFGEEETRKLIWEIYYDLWTISKKNQTFIYNNSTVGFT